jgi:hypothetical protein
MECSSALTHPQLALGVAAMIGGVVGAAPLPGCAGQGRVDRGHEAGVGVAGDQLDAGQSAGGQVAEEPEPAGAVLGGADL